MTLFACTLQQLPDILAENGLTLSPHHALRITQDIVEGLSHVHHKKLMHRDLKSDNVALALPVAAMMASSCSAPALASVAPTAEAAMRSSSVADVATLPTVSEVGQGAGALDGNSKLPRASLPTVSLPLSPPSSLTLTSCEATEPSACIIDFGMARAFDVLDHDNDLAAHLMEADIVVHDDDDDSDEDDHFPVRAVSERVSIPLYCAPEIALSHGLYDSKADMWAGAKICFCFPVSLVFRASLSRIV